MSREDLPGHSEEKPWCQAGRIQDLAQSAEAEYYLGVLGAVHRSVITGAAKERAARSVARIQEYLSTFQQLKRVLICVACQLELDRQVELQNQAIAKIQQTWGF